MSLLNFMVQHLVTSKRNRIKHRMNYFHWFYTSHSSFLCLQVSHSFLNFLSHILSPFHSLPFCLIRTGYLFEAWKTKEWDHRDVVICTNTLMFMSWEHNANHFTSVDSIFKGTNSPAVQGKWNTVLCFLFNYHY